MNIDIIKDLLEEKSNSSVLQEVQNISASIDINQINNYTDDLDNMLRSPEDHFKDILNEKYDLTPEELDEIIQKHYPERTL